MGRVRVVLPEPHPGQAEVLASDARFNVLACGRRWGKTFLASGRAIEMAARGQRVWWVAPTYRVAKIGWRGIVHVANQIPGVDIHRGDWDVFFPGGGEIGVRSAHNPDHLRGEGLDGLIIDEAALIKRTAWEEALRPTLTDTGGWAMIISTPKGANWFREVWERGRRGDPGWRSWQFPSWTNPHISHEDIEEARKSLPDRIFRQEYGAEFIADAGAVFRRVSEAIAPVWRDEPEPGHVYVFGVDWAKLNDWTVITVLDATTNAAVYIERMNQIDYRFQAQRLRALYERWRPSIVYAEENSIGEGAIERLVELNVPVYPISVGGHNKTAIIEGLALAIEQGEIALPPYDELILELQAYESERLPSGRFRYNAPEGYHDDCVISLALAWYGVRRGGVLIDFV